MQITIILTLINSIFLYKYISRVTPLSLMVTIIYGSLFCLIPYFYTKINFKLKQPFFWVIITFYILCIIGIYFKTDANDFRVDRASAVVNFWDAALKGNYPYSAGTHISGAYQYASPMLLVLAFPFYLIKELGIMSLSGVILLAIFLYRKYQLKNLWQLSILMVIFSPLVGWELVVRSNLIINMAIILFTLQFLSNKNVEKISVSVLSGILFGILLSTRSVLAIPIALWYSYSFFQKRLFKQALICGTLIITTFILTILPFALWDFQQFKIHNPLLFQSSFMPVYLSTLFILAAFFQGFILRRLEDIYQQIGLNLFLCILTYSIFKIVKYGFSAAFFDSKIDLSYFLIPYCFLLTSLSDVISTKAININLHEKKDM